MLLLTRTVQLGCRLVVVFFHYYFRFYYIVLLRVGPEKTEKPMNIEKYIQPLNCMIIKSIVKIVQREREN